MSGQRAIRDLFGRMHTRVHLPDSSVAHVAWREARIWGFVETTSYTDADGQETKIVELTPRGVEARNAYFAAEDAGKVIGRPWKGPSIADRQQR